MTATLQKKEKRKGKCRTCKFSAACLGIPSFPLRFIKCECGRCYHVKLPENYKGNARLLEGDPDLCPEMMGKIQMAEYCVHCYEERYPPT